MNTVLCIAVAVVGGLLMTRLAKLVHLPNVTAYLVAGLLVGPCCLNLLDAPTLKGLDILTTIALGFIAFSIGGEFRWADIKSIGKSAVIITLFEALTAMVLVFAVLFACGFEAPLVLCLGAIATATAPAATLMVVRQYRAKGPVTNTLLPVVAMDDAVCLMSFSVCVAIAAALVSGQEASFYTMVLAPVLSILMSLGIGAALGLLLSVAMRFFHSKQNRLILCVGAVLAGLGISALLSLSDLLVCMSLSVVMVNLRKDAGDVLGIVDGWTGPIFLLFFVISGAELDITVLPTVGLLGVLYLAARSAGKYLGAMTGATLMKSPPQVRKYLGVTLLPQAGVAIGMSQVAVTALPEYASVIRVVVLSATLVYELAGPLCTKFALTKAGEIEGFKKIKKA